MARKRIVGRPIFGRANGKSMECLASLLRVNCYSRDSSELAGNKDAPRHFFDRDRRGNLPLGSKLVRWSGKSCCSSQALPMFCKELIVSCVCWFSLLPIKNEHRSVHSSHSRMARQLFAPYLVPSAGKNGSAAARQRTGSDRPCIEAGSARQRVPESPTNEGGNV